ncbi:MAG TPA: twin-arginine translocation signal domain-containing protein [Brevefilum sp.]
MKKNKLSRRDFLKLQGLAAGGLALASSNVNRLGPASKTCDAKNPCVKVNAPDQKNSLFEKLETCCINEPLAEDEMRVTFLGTSCTPMLTQQGLSVYVEVGPTHPITAPTGRVFNEPADYALFDCGMGCLANYIAAGIPYSRMDKIFISHLHADHMSELSAIYCFGESADRKKPMYVWGPSKSNIPDPVTGEIHEDGIRETLEHFRALWRWHTEAFSFTSNGFKEYLTDVLPDLREKWGLPAAIDLTPAGKYSVYQDPPNDAYALVPIELNWEDVGGVAYDNQTTGLKITHFPVIHCRQGSIGFKLAFTPPNQPEKTLSMVYSGDTKPNWTMVDKAAGIDLLVHELVMPPDAWTAKFLHIDIESVIGNPSLPYFTDVQNSSHTTQGAFGYLLSQIDPKPRLTVATHFQATDDTIESARQSLDAYCIPRDVYTFASDFMVFNITQDEIRQRRLDVSKHEFPYGYLTPGTPEPPKYFKLVWSDQLQRFIPMGDPEAQLLLDDQIDDGPETYEEGGYWPGEDYSPQCRD